MSSISKACLSLVAALFFCCTIALAQQPWTLQWGAQHKPENPGSIYNIVHTDQQGYYALRCQLPNHIFSDKPHKATLELYNKELNFVKAEALEMDYKGEALEFVDFISLKDKHFLLTSYYNASQEKKYLFARSVNMQTLKCEGEYIKITEMETSRKFHHPFFDLSFSPDSSLLLIYAYKHYLNRKKDRISLTVVDANVKVLWAKNLDPDSLKDSEVYSHAIDNQGNAYLLAAGYRTENDKKTGKKMGEYYSVFAYLNDGTNFKEYEVSLEGKYITNMVFEALKNGDLLCTGFYSDKKNSEIIVTSERTSIPFNGFFSIKLNVQNDKEYDKTVQEFDIDIRSSDLSSRKQKKVKNKDDNSGQALKNYNICQLRIQEDGSYLLLGEKQYIRSSPGYGKSSPSRAIPHHDDLLIIKVSPNGSIVWVCKVDKEQQDMHAGEFVFVPTNDKQYFIYQSGWMMEQKLATVSSDGKVTYTPFHEENFKVPNSTLLSSSTKTVLVWPESNAKTRLGKLVFQ